MTNTKTHVSALAVFFLMIAAGGGAARAADESAKVVIRGTPVTVDANTTHGGDLIVSEGKATVKGRVTGSVVVLGGLALISRYGMGFTSAFRLTEFCLAVTAWFAIAFLVGRLMAQWRGWRINAFVSALAGVGVCVLAFIIPIAGQIATVLAVAVGVGALLAPFTGPLPEAEATDGNSTTATEVR